MVSKAINDLAGGQLVYDNMRNSIWFTDARTNSIGRLDIKSAIIQLFAIPTQSSGPMGIVLSPDSKSIWIAEITGNKIASLDLTSNNIDGRKIIEYHVSIGALTCQQDTRPTFLAFDKRGVLWVTMSYTHSLLRVEPWMLVPGSSSMMGGMSNFTLQQKSDIFSPFGIAVVNAAHNSNSASTIANDAPERIATTSKTDNNNEKKERIVLSDHGSSRILISSGNIDTNPL